MNNGVIPFIMGYRWPILRPPWDVITMKKKLFDIIWDDLLISDVILNLCFLFQSFQSGFHFEIAINVFTGGYTGS